MPSIDNYRIVFLNFNNLPAGCFPYSQNIHDFPRLLIAPSEDEHPDSEHWNPNQQKRYSYKSCDSAKGKPCPHQAENKSKYPQDERNNPPGIGD